MRNLSLFGVFLAAAPGSRSAEAEAFSIVVACLTQALLLADSVVAKRVTLVSETVK